MDVCSVSCFPIGGLWAVSFSLILSWLQGTLEPWLLMGEPFTQLHFYLFYLHLEISMKWNSVLQWCLKLGSPCWKEKTGFSRGAVVTGLLFKGCNYCLVQHPRQGGAAKVSQNPGNKAGTAAWWLTAKSTFPDMPLQQALVSDSAPRTMTFCNVNDQSMNWASHRLHVHNWWISWRLSGNLSGRLGQT